MVESNEKINKPSGVIKRRGRRALRACDGCRRLKTRCIPSPLPNEIQCLRCDSLKIRCSFQDLLEDTDSADEICVQKTPQVQPLHESAEWTKRLLKSGYSTDDLALHSKLLHAINENVLKVIDMMEGSNNSQLSVGALPKARTIDSALIDAVKMMASTSSQTLIPSNPSTSQSRCGTPILDDSLLKTEQRHFAPYLASPFTMVSQMISRDNLPLPIFKLHESDMLQQDPLDDIVTLNLVTLEEVHWLMQDFRDRYGNWCSFPETISTEKLVSNIRSRNASLLLSASCVMALRYTVKYHDLKTRVYKNLLFKLKSDLETSLKCVPQTTEFIQAIVILSIYASSFSSDIMSVDAWYLSGIGLQQYLTRNIADALLRSGNDKATTSEFFSFGISNNLVSPQENIFDQDMRFERLTSFRLWNHLCLVHITHCVFSGRMCIVDEVRADLCRRTLELSNSTNFDGRMVAEISLQLIVYNFMQQCNTEIIGKPSNDPTAFDTVIDELRDWIDEWGYLFSQPIQPTTQYVEFAYHYGYATVLYTWFHKCYRLAKSQVGRKELKSQESQGLKSAKRSAVGEYLNSQYPVEEVIGAIPHEKQLEMLDHAHRSVETMINDNFSSFRYLSDQLFFSCMHCSLICLMVAHSLYHAEECQLKDSHLEKILTDVKKFSLRLQKIREGELKSFWVEEVDLKVPSVILQYHKAIESCLQDKFPEYEINVDDDL